MERKLLVAPWAAMLLGSIAVGAIALRGDTGRARAATEYLGPKEAEVSIEDGDVRTVHLTSSKFMWQFRDDQPPVEVWGYNNQIPGSTLRFRAGDKVRIYYRNDLDEASTVHWHGLVVPNSMDGVGLLTMPPVMPGETFVYEYTVPNTPGTFMYHAHMDDLMQVSMGLSGAFIVEQRDGGDAKYDQDRVLLLNNIQGHYLIDGKEFPNIDPWLVKKGDLLRVRMINISPIELHPMHFHGHFTKEISRDGTAETAGASAKVENTVLIAPGQTIDVEVRMNAPGKGAWIWHCHILSHVMGPDGKSLNLAKANGGMVIPVVYIPTASTSRTSSRRFRTRSPASSRKPAVPWPRRPAPRARRSAMRKRPRPSTRTDPIDERPGRKAVRRRSSDENEAVDRGHDRHRVDARAWRRM